MAIPSLVFVKDQKYYNYSQVQFEDLSCFHFILLNWVSFISYSKISFLSKEREVGFIERGRVKKTETQQQQPPQQQIGAQARIHSHL